MESIEVHGSKRFLGLLLSLALPVAFDGCTAIDYDERTDGLDIVADVDGIFTVSLPYPPGKPGLERLTPEIAGQALRFLARGINGVRTREWFKFSAEEAGEAAISISTRDEADSRRKREYSLNVKVRRGEW